MISKSQIKLITSLQQKKYRIKTGLFIAEGPKIIKDIFSSGVILEHLFSVDDASDITQDYQTVTREEIQKITALKTASSMLAVFKTPAVQKLEDSGLSIALDRVRDPGNLGTIIRLCNWFGITQILCTKDTVDCFNPKVVQATMGAIAHVSLHYLDLEVYLQYTKRPVYAATMEGENVYKTKLPQDAILVMGNEAQGVSTEILGHAAHNIRIPQFAKADTAESLNVATATAILLSEFRRTIET